MAKVEKLKVRMTTLSAFADKEKIREIDIVEWLSSLLEERYTLVFETVVTDTIKSDFIYSADRLWLGAKETAQDMRESDVLTCLYDYFVKIGEYDMARDYDDEEENIFEWFYRVVGIFFLKRKKIMLGKALAMFFVLRPDLDLEAERKKLMRYLDESIVSHTDVKQKFQVAEVLALIPEVWPQKNSFFTVDDVPHLDTLIHLVKAKGYSGNEILSAWKEMLSMRDEAYKIPDMWKSVGLAEAFYVMFAKVSEETVEKHYPALIALAEN